MTGRAAQLQIEVARWLVADDDARAVAEGILATNGGSLPGGRRHVVALFDRVATVAQDVAAAVEAET
jgi:hypothetical protein